MKYFPSSLVFIDGSVALACTRCGKDCENEFFEELIEEKKDKGPDDKMNKNADEEEGGLFAVTVTINKIPALEGLSIVQLCADCWKEFREVLKSIDLYGVDVRKMYVRDNKNIDENSNCRKCFMCNSDAEFSFEVGIEKSEVLIDIIKTFCFIFLCKDCVLNFVKSMKGVFSEFSNSEIYDYFLRWYDYIEKEKIPEV